MKTRLWMTLTALALLLGILASPAEVVLGQAVGRTISIATTPGGNHQEKIEILFDGTSSSSASKYLYIRQAGADELTGVTLSVVNLLDPKGIAAEGYALTFSVNDQPLPEAGVTLTPNTELVIRLDLSNFTQEGVFSGDLLVKAAGNLVASTKLTITRLPKPALAIAGVTSSGITRTQLTNHAEYTFQIYSTNTTDVEDLDFSVDNFAKAGVPDIAPQGIGLFDDQGAPLAADTTSGLYRVKGLGSITLKFTLDLIEAGDYQGQITLIYDQQRFS